jgi:phage terminase large subunit
VRKSFPAVRASVMRDFFTILHDLKLYSEEYHSKSENTYHLNGNLIEFISLDMPQKIRGRKRNLLFINEANELSFEDWQQLIFRTDEKIIIDYNPSDEFHWIYERILTREDVSFHRTTFLDNPFLSDVIKDEILRLKDIDENYWRVYGLGERGQSRSLVFSFTEVEKVPETAKFMAYGLDFGFTNHPTALVALYIEGDNMYWDELLYQTGMTNIDIADTLRSLELDRRDIIWADSAEPKAITEIHRFGFNIREAKKGPDSVNMGIDMIRRYKLFISKRSINLGKELKNYKYIEDRDGRLTNKPIDAFNHGTDGARYAVFNSLSRPNIGKYSVI